MQQIMEHQQVNRYRSMMEEESNLTPLESNLCKSDLAVISHIIHMVEVDNFWHQKTFEAVLANLWTNWEKKSMNMKIGHCTVKKTQNPTKRWKRKKLLTSAVKARP